MERKVGRKRGKENRGREHMAVREKKYKGRGKPRWVFWLAGGRVKVAYKQEKTLPLPDSPSPSPPVRSYLSPSHLSEDCVWMPASEGPRGGRSQREKLEGREEVKERGGEASTKG